MSAANLPALCSWSGGKDSCLALHLEVYWFADLERA